MAGAAPMRFSRLSLKGVAQHNETLGSPKAPIATRRRMCYFTIVKFSERPLERLPAEFKAVIWSV
jgi:hypothetical protein